MSKQFGSRPTKNAVHKAVYFNHDLLAELEAESKRLQRPLTWLIRQSWKLARAAVQSLRAPPTI